MHALQGYAPSKVLFFITICVTKSFAGVFFNVDFSNLANEDFCLPIHVHDQI